MNTIVLLFLGYFQLNPYPDSQGRPTKEIEEFAPKEVFAPFLTYK